MKRLGWMVVWLAGCDVDPYCIGCGGAADVGSLDATTTDAGDTSMSPDAALTDVAACVFVGEEVCNRADEDCDGRIDEGFDLMADPRHCGACNRACTFPNSDVDCVAGMCEFRECLPGYVDLDAAPGCETRCEVFPTTGEDCNGLDDDCDGMTDEAAGLPPPPADLCRTTVGTPCEGVRPICATREGVTTWFCNYGTGVEFDPVLPNGIVLDETRCDGLDGDCDGRRDEVFATLGSTCDNGLRGACRDPGRIVCDSADASRVRCDLGVAPGPISSMPTAEICNGIDDDCDGIIDNSDPTDPNRVRQDMIHIVRGGLDFWIDRFEASRPDATATSVGTRQVRSCSRSGVLPWTGVAYADAAEACAGAGLRLCTGAEWQAACEGAAANLYPYGATYDTDACNGADARATPAIGATSAYPMCRSTDGAIDMSGNVKEWTNDPRGMSGTGRSIYVVRGGSYDSPQLGLSCRTDLSRATSDTVLGTLGFRCCSSAAP